MADPIYNLDYELQINNLLPVNKRTATFKAWLTALCAPLQWLRDTFFTYYTDGGVTALWSNVTAYVAGDPVVDDIDNGVYICFLANTGNQPSTSTAVYWQKAADDWRGVAERIKYTSQKMTLEYILNRFYRLTFSQPDQVANPQSTRPSIYIDNNVLKNTAFIIANDVDSASNVRNADNDAFIMNDYSFIGYAFTIFVPDSGGSPYPGWYTALAPFAEEKIRSIADRYVIAGMTYDIQTY